MRKALVIALFHFGIAAVATESKTEDDSEKEIEEEFRDAFRSAFSNRSDEVGQFFNQTFGQGGNATEIADRFRTAWQGDSEGVRHFVNETYWNITRVLQGDNPQGYGGVNMEEVTAMISKHRSKSDKIPNTPSDGEHDSVVDKAWNHFKNVFAPSKPVQNKSPEPATASIPAPAQSSHNGLFLMLISLFASVILVFQTTFNRNGFVNKQVYNEPARVPNGYVRIA